MKPVSPDVKFPEIEKSALQFWRERDTFKRSLEIRKDARHYMFYDGPPFATGTPHYGHLLAGTIKDIVPRYQTMRGFYVERRFGWDCHGLPIEMLVERDLNLKGRADILEYGVDRFNETCRSGVLRYVEEWESVTTRLGRWIDFVDDYKTMDVEFMDSVWWVIRQLWEKGRIYEGLRVMPYSWRLSTPLSNFEASANYKDVQDPAITVRFPLREKPGTAILAWTTTPWTLISNMGLCVGPDLDYVEVQTRGDASEKLILAEARVSAYFKSEDEYQVVARYKGTDLTKFTYQPPFQYFIKERESGAFRVVNDAYVSTEDGTGVVHQSPAHGEDDFRIGRLFGIPLVDPVDKDGNFDQTVPDFKGQNIKEADKGIIRALKESGRLFKQDTLVHSYPFCERSDTPLIYKAISAWYVKVEDLRDDMVRNNQSIHWIPEHIKDGRFGNWLANARDWNISRNRFWGNPLPIWKCEKCEHTVCIGSRGELEKKIGSAVPDLHKHFVDKLHWACEKCGSQMTRIPEVLDCWFESGSMPYAQLHYPFENKERFDHIFPADFIAEGLDQTRGWFYTLMILSTILFEKAPFKNCVVNGLILAEDGKKMSKRLKNYPDPSFIMEEYGADALRMYMINSPVVKGESLRFSESGVKEIVRSVMLPLWNVYSFFTTYADVDRYTPSKEGWSSGNELDRWIMSRLQTLVGQIEKQMEEYRLYAVVPILLEFLEELTNWYLRRSRRRFWSEDPADKQNGYDTLYQVMTGFVQALAPFIPFITEEIYRNLATLGSNLPESVHLCDYPRSNPKLRDEKLESDMALIQCAVGLGRSLRARLNLKVRQPLRSITVVTRKESDSEVLKRFEQHIIDELNIKKVEFSSNEEDLVELTVKPNFPMLGPIFGKEMGNVGRELGRLSPSEVSRLEDGGKISVCGKEVGLEALLITRKGKAGVEIQTARGVTVFFDTKLDDELLSEGMAREFVNRVQKMRKDANLHVSDRIKIQYSCEDRLVVAVQRNSEYIQGETLALELIAGEASSGAAQIVEQHSIDGIDLRISLFKVTNI